MIKQIFAVKDTKTNEHTLITSQNKATAMREFGEWVKSIRFAQDQELWHVGTYEVLTGRVIPLETTSFVCNYADVCGGDDAQAGN